MTNANVQVTVTIKEDNEVVKTEMLALPLYDMTVDQWAEYAETYAKGYDARLELLEGGDMVVYVCNVELDDEDETEVEQRLTFEVNGGFEKFGFKE